MPGGYGRSGPWGSSGDTYGSRPSAPPGRDPGGHHFGGGNQSNQSNQSNQQSQADQRRELAESLKAAGQVSGNLAFGLFKTAPVGTTDKKVLEYLENPNVYYSTYGKGADAYTTAFQDDLTGYGGLVYSDPDNYNPYNRGYFTPFNPANYPDEYPGFGGYNDLGVSTSQSWYEGGGGGGSGGGGGGGYIEQELPPRGNPNERWGAQTPWQQIMINTHAGKGFQQGYARGGIVSLVE